MGADYHRLLLLFVDGIGLAEASADNPFAIGAAPNLDEILGGPLTLESCGRGAEWSLSALDARLDVAGLPQSATGQASLFTGINAASWMGRHVSGLPGPRLRSLISGRGILGLAAKAGLHATFANAYSESYLRRLARGDVRPSVTTCLMQDAGLRFRTESDLERGRALTWDIEGDLFGPASGFGGRLEPVEAGRRLANLTNDHDLTIFETFLPDLAAHGRVPLDEFEVLTRIDGLLAGVLADRTRRSTVIVTSDHGNFESIESSAHTMNPVPLLAIGARASSFAGVSSIDEVAPVVLEILADAPSKVSR